MKIKILGNTIWGSTLGLLLSNAGNEVDLIFRNNDKLIESKNSSKLSIANKKIDKPNKINFTTNFIDLTKILGLSYNHYYNNNNKIPINERFNKNFYTCPQTI